MERKLADCPHCGGKRNCTRSGGRSCRDCLAAAGRSVHQWGVVRCSYCGGRGKVWVEEEEEAVAESDQSLAQAPAEGAGPGCADDAGT